jgi:enoyl-CoA hydratase
MSEVTYTPESRTVRFEAEGPVRLITLNRPDKLNAADLELQRTLLECLTAVREDESAGAVVVTGAGRGFSAGGDRAVLDQFLAGNRSLQAELSEIHHRTLECVFALSIPVIAAVNGPAVGFGAELAALCDIVIMAEDAFISEPHVKYGIAASPGCQLVWPHLLSWAVAKELLLSGRAVGADEAVRIGLANRVVPNGQELPTAMELAGQLASLSRPGVASTKRAFNRILAEEAARMNP